MMLPSGDTHKCACGKWWLKSDFSRGGRTYATCPFCRYDRTKKTQYWLGDESPRANDVHDWPSPTKATTPATPPAEKLPLAKRQRPVDEEIETARGRKLNRIAQPPSPVSPLANSSTLAAQSRSSSTASSSIDPGPTVLETNATRLLRKLANCNNNPSDHKSKELISARRRKSVSTTSLVNLQLQVPTETTKVQQVVERLAKLDDLYNNFRALTKESGVLAKEEEDELMAAVHKPVQKAYNDSGRAKAELDRMQQEIEVQGNTVAETAIVVEGIEKERKLMQEWMELTMKFEG